MALTREEERSIIAAYVRTRDPRLEDRLVRANLGLVRSMANAYHASGIDPRDLSQEGALGLLHAIRRFEPRHKVKLATYAAWWIRAYQFRYLIQNFRLVRIGTTQQQRRVFFKLSTLRARLTAAGLDASAERIATLLDVDAETVRQLEPRLEGRDVSLDAPHHENNDESRVSRLTDEGTPPDELASAREIARIVRVERDRFRARLDRRRRALFDARWLDDDTPTLQEMGNRFGVTRERARQLEQRMLRELRVRLEGRLSAA
jgi:RNA polymerase sigma-32 factor